MAKYKLTTDANTVIRDDGASIPVNFLENRDSKEYAEWLAAGNTPDPIDLSVRIDIALAELLAKRDEDLVKNVVSDGHIFFADKESQNLLNQTLSSQERGIEGIFPANWLLADGSVLAASYDDLKAVNVLMAQRTSTDYSNYFSLVQQILSSQNPENVDISSGWSTV